jgi:hypothetical protein
MKLITVARNTAIAAAMSMFAAASATAATYNAGALNQSPKSGTEFVGVGSFADYLNFNVSSAYPVVGGAVMDVPFTFTFGNLSSTLYNITGLTVALYNGSNGSGTLIPPSTGPGDYLPVSGVLDSGHYSLKISGTGEGSSGGMYTWTMLAQPVPEPETYAMMLAGFGAIGFMARRRKQNKA